MVELIAKVILKQTLSLHNNIGTKTDGVSFQRNETPSGILFDALCYFINTKYTAAISRMNATM